MLGADGKSDGVGLDTLFEKLGFGELGVSCGSRVDNQGLNVGNVGKQGEYRQVVDELLSVLCGCLLRYSTTFSALNTWRSTRSERVSRPWRNMNAWNGEIVAPVSRRRIALM